MKNTLKKVQILLIESYSFTPAEFKSLLESFILNP